MNIHDNQSLISKARSEFHRRLLDHGVLSINDAGKASNADTSSAVSVTIANHIAVALQAETGEKLAGQTSGSEFETIIAQYVEDTLAYLGHIRPGRLSVAKVGSRNSLGIAVYEQYRHLRALKEAADNDPVLATSIGRDYTVAPDIVVYREPMTDDEINTAGLIVDDESALKTDLRATNGGGAVLLASISAKWTMRSDRAQNSRSEALNLIRNRKGGLPRIMVVTAEPLPSRLSSLALGTGDIDCVYHFALYELQEAVRATRNEEALALLNIMIDGKRLKDISDLTLDLVI